MLTRNVFGLSPYLKGSTYLHQSIITDFLQQATIFSAKRSQPLSHLIKNEKLFYNHALTNKDQPTFYNSVNNKEISDLDVLNTVTVLSKLYNRIKSNKEDDKNAIVNVIFNLIKMDGHKLEIPIIINILQTLIDYKMPYIQKHIEIILKFIKNQLINLTPKDYQELTDINSKIQSNTLRQFVQKDLLQKFNLKISMDLDRNNLDFVISAFMNHKNDLEKLKLALEAVKNCNIQNASLNTILNLITAMSYVTQFPKNYCSILNKLQIYLIENIHKLKTNDILFLLHNMVFAADNNKNEEFYNEALFNKCAEVITSRDVTSAIAAACLNSFIRIRHMQKHLLDYTCSRYFIEKNNEVRFKEEFVLSSLISAYAQYNLKDVYLQKLIKNYEEIIKLSKSKKILDSALNFAVLEYYNASLLTNIFSNEEFYFNAAGRKFVNLWQKLKTTPNYNGPEPSEKCIKKFTIWHTKYNFELFPYLEKGLGGSIYIKKNLKTKLYHQIEYITMFRNGGYPIAINNIEDKNIEYIEDLQVPNNSKIVLIFEIPNYWYFQNSNIIIGKYSMYIDVIKSLSVEVIPINLNNWKTLSENEKIPYLMKEIHSKLMCDNNFMLST